MRRFYIPPGETGRGQACITGREAHHLRKVMRLRIGDEITVFDGTGADCQARIIALDGDCVRVEILTVVTAQTESPLHLTLAQGYLKDKKMDLLVRPLTELGVSRWIPFMAHRSVPEPDERRMRQRTDRWRTLSREALKQCRRSRPMDIELPATFEKTLEAAQSSELKIIFWEGIAAPGGIETPRHAKAASAFVMIGPEGGFEPEELKQAQAAGFDPLGMGPRILRAETAALAACALVQFLFGDLGKPAR